MELHRVHNIFHPNHLGEEKQQMLNLNRRLETYLSRVKCLEEENEMLANEIKVWRHNNQGTLTRRRGLEEELRQARLEVDAAWRERVLTEVEVQKLTEEIQVLEMQRQMEAEAKMLANTKMEQSRKELEDEQRAQIWLKEKVNQLEHEMKFLIQTHEEDVAHLEATLSRSRAEMLPNQIHRSKQAPDLLKMGHEFSQRATRAWQEASESYQGQLAQLEESLDQARSRLSQVCLEKRENQLKLQTLEKEFASAQDVRLHLEKTVAQRREEHCEEIQQLGKHLEELEVEKVELGQQIDHLLQENHSLMQMKMSLGLEVATYRALLDGEGHGRDAVLLNKPRSISSRDAVLSPHGVKKNYPIQLSASLKTTYPSSDQGRTGSIITATQFLSRRPAALREAPKTSSKPAETAAVKSVILESPYPKIVQNGAAEHFRPEEVHEEVTYAEPLSPPKEKEASNRMSEDEDKTVIERVFESVVSHTAVLGLSREERLNEKAANQQFSALSPISCDVRITELPCNFSDEQLKDLAFEGETEEENIKNLRAQADGSTKVEYVQDETSDSETEAMLEPTFESRPRSPESECEPLNVFNRNDESISNVDAVVMRQESISATVEVNERDDEDKLYPDGEEMDTWDSVIERKVRERINDGVENEGNKQHAEPEEDISTKDPEEKRKVGQEGNMDSALPQADEGHHALWELEHVPPPDKEEGGDEEDSQNISMSWRTELESDSYAQDNTLADIRPLIRYKSDDTDGNTQASHIEESESSEGEQEKKPGEAGSGTWTDGKPKTFGTMEDLCEEVEEETVDDDYNMGYTHVEDRDPDQGKKVSAFDILLKDDEKVEEMMMSGVEGHSEEETEELTGATVHTNIDYDEELETDRLVEQELENLSTDSYSAHFGHEKVREDILGMKEQETKGNTSIGESENYESALTTAVINKSLERHFLSDSSPEIQLESTVTEEEVREQNETEKTPGGSSSEIVKSEFEPATTITRDASEMQLFSDPSVEIPSTNIQLVNEQKGTEKLIEDTESSEPEMSVNYQQLSSTTVEDVALEKQLFSESYAEINSTNKLTEEDFHPIDQEAVDNPETREDDDEHNLVSHVDGTENHSELKDFLSRSDMEDSNMIKASSSVLPVTADSNPPQDVDIPNENTGVLPKERSNVSQEHPTDDAEDFHKFLENGETIEWENPENTTEESEMSDQIKHVIKNDNLHEISDEIIMDQEDPVEVSLDSALNENDIFKVKDVKDSRLHSHFTSDVKNDFWVSSLETGATYTPNDTCNESAEQTNHNQGFADKRDLGNLENPKVINGNSTVDIDLSGPDPTKEQEQANAEVKKMFCKNVVEGEMVHSEESDVEAESWSSGEETA